MSFFDRYISNDRSKAGNLAKSGRNGHASIIKNADIDKLVN